MQDRLLRTVGWSNISIMSLTLWVEKRVRWQAFIDGMRIILFVQYKSEAEQFLQF